MYTLPYGLYRIFPDTSFPFSALMPHDIYIILPAGANRSPSGMLLYRRHKNASLLQPPAVLRRSCPRSPNPACPERIVCCFLSISFGKIYVLESADLPKDPVIAIQLLHEYPYYRLNILSCRIISLKPHKRNKSLTIFFQ